MDTKTCPSCGTEVPSAATRCKTCFHDFTEEPVRNGSPVALLVALALAVVIAAGAFWYVSQIPTDKRILVDQETQTIQWITQFSDHLETDRVTFAEITKIEHIVTSSGAYQIVAVTTSGDRKVVEEDRSKSLALQAQRYAAMMQKPLENKDETFGFMKQDWDVRSPASQRRCGRGRGCPARPGDRSPR